MKLNPCGYDVGVEQWSIDLPDRLGCLVKFDADHAHCHIERAGAKYRYNADFAAVPVYVGPEFDTPEEAALYAVMNLEVR